MSTPLLALTDRGLYCEAGDFFVDPWRRVERAVITHAHGDHARRGSAAYLASRSSVPLLDRRLDPGSAIEGMAWGERRRIGGTTVSFHPAGHVLGSAQVRIEGPGESGRTEVWVASGDYKRAADPTCEPFEPVPCDTFISEATFALPIYRWPRPGDVAAEVLAWWDGNRAEGRASLLLAYSLGKAQRLLGELARLTDRPAWTHGAVETLTEVYRAAGVVMLPTRPVAGTERGRSFAGELIVAPPSAYGSPWSRRFGSPSVAFASGWMRIRGTRRRRGFDRGFVLSDHADWPALLATIAETGAQRVLATHGYSASLARYLAEEHGLDAAPLATPYTGEAGEEAEAAEAAEEEGPGSGPDVGPEGGS